MKVYFIGKKLKNPTQALVDELTYTLKNYRFGIYKKQNILSDEKSDGLTVVVDALTGDNVTSKLPGKR